MLRSIQNSLFLILGCLLLAACTGTRNLPKGEKLYTGAEIKLESSDKVNKKFIKATALLAVRPVPNKVYLGIRPKLWKYNLAGEDPKTKLGKWFKKRGEPPVLMSSVKPGVTRAIIDARLFNIGIFKSYTESKIVEKERTGKVIYTSHVHKPYLVKDLVYAIRDDSISRLILTGKDKSLIKPGDDYNLDILKSERIRIDAILKNNGYFYFNPDYLLFKADTSNVNHDVAFKLTLKDSIPKNATTAFRINNVYINQNYSLNDRRKDTTKDTIVVQNIVFFGKEARMTIRPKVLSKSIYLRKNEIFSRQNHIITLNRLMSMGNFKLVQINFSENNASGPGLLDVNILMTPLPKHTFRAEVDLVTKSNNYAGPRVNLSILNRNAFNGAEILNLNLAGSFEAQLSGKEKNLYSYSYNPQLELTFPRFIVPFNIKRTNSLYVPKTRLLLSYNYLKRVNYFDMRTFQFVYGFKWKQNIQTEHELNPIDISYTTIRNKSTAFTDLLTSNPFLKKSYEEQFIAGGNYSFTYNEQMMTGKKIQYYFHLISELAGNALYLAKVIGGEKISAENPSKVAGSIFSQYSKLSVDGRFYYNLKDKNKVALRFFAGVAKPFGNSLILPYSKQFFSGGPNSLRAFQINSVGPGTYNQKTDTLGILQLGGDIKLEMNAEYRFNIYRFLKGALFVDAGNVWLQKSNPTNLGSPFLFSKFMNEIAVGAGVGLRVDVSFFILRFDLAFPLRKPWLEENHRWVADQINFGNSGWRRENLVLNVAIGYPF
ncbi:MAG: outer membrane protein assembly factor [Prolixibacteraceae bacterium]|nr:outer membrane protein assembly factor [Prolixibacteraceae bacterium]